MSTIREKAVKAAFDSALSEFQMRAIAYGRIQSEDHLYALNNARRELIAAIAADAVREKEGRAMGGAVAVQELLGHYWQLAYNEGKEGRTHDTENGDAQKTLHAILSALRAQPQGDAEPPK